MADTKPDNREKWMASLIAGVMFLVVASPYLYKLVNQMTSSLGLVIADRSGCPNVYGLVLHSIVFTLLVRALMMKDDDGSVSNKNKWAISAISGLMFLVISSPYLYQQVNKLTEMAGLSIANKSGCPTMYGVGAHAVVFTLLTRALMK